MYIQSCQHPQIVHNPYLDKDITVPCGKCNTCLSHRAQSWIQRLELERSSSAYTVFFTLTYADEYLPLLDLGWSKSAFLPDKLVHKKRDFSNLPLKNLSDEYNNFEISLDRTILSERTTENIRNNHAGYIPYCSVYDLQNFIKRLRSKLYRKAYGSVKGLSQSQKIRYFLCTEYGPTTLRPHCHGILFFDDSKLQACLSDVFSQAWPFGRYDLQYVTSSASSYVARYVNSFSRLPRIYQSTSLRPFCLCSRQEPIGLRALKSSTIKELFDSSSPLVSIPDESGNGFTYVPLWRSLEDRLYPILPQNSTLSPQLRLELLRCFTHLSQSDFHSFVSELALTVSALCANDRTTSVIDYLSKICPLSVSKFNDYVTCEYALMYEPVIRRLFYAVRRISILMYRFNCDLRSYCTHFDNYQSNKKLYLLQQQYLYQEDFTKYTNTRFLINIDNVFFRRLRSLSWNDMTPTLLLQLYGYGFTYSEIKEAFKNEKSKVSYFKQLNYTNTLDFVEMVSVHNKIINDSRKTRRKNEYLELHPEYKTLY